MFGAAPPPIDDPLLESQVAVNQLLVSLRTTSMEFGSEIGRINALTGIQISSAKMNLNQFLITTKNSIKLAQNSALLQGSNIDICVTQSNNAIGLVNIKELKLCSKSPELATARANMNQLKLLQLKAKNSVPTCQLQFPSPTQTDDVNNCVTETIEALTTEFTNLRDQNTNILNEASQNTCVADTQAKLQESIETIVNNFNDCCATNNV